LLSHDNQLVAVEKIVDEDRWASKASCRPKKSSSYPRKVSLLSAEPIAFMDLSHVRDCSVGGCGIA
ncbi:MAG: hypothetical protein ACRCZF_06670, partial [Gemmataceae bacterium]